MNFAYLRFPKRRRDKRGARVFTKIVRVAWLGTQNTIVLKQNPH